MSIKFQKPSSGSSAKDFRLSFPAELWEQIEAAALKEEIEPAEVIRQTIADSLKKYFRKPRQAKA